jgi:hypothetical protein
MQYIVAEQPCPMPDSRFAAHGWKKKFSLASQIVMKNSCEKFEFMHKIIAYSLLECQALQPELKIANPHPA